MADEEQPEFEGMPEPEEPHFDSDFGITPNKSRVKIKAITVDNLVRQFNSGDQIKVELTASMVGGGVDGSTRVQLFEMNTIKLLDHDGAEIRTEEQEARAAAKATHEEPEPEEPEALPAGEIEGEAEEEEISDAEVVDEGGEAPEDGSEPPEGDGEAPKAPDPDQPADGVTGLPEDEGDGDPPPADPDDLTWE
jgi:hypothetical protein